MNSTASSGSEKTGSPLAGFLGGALAGAFWLASRRTVLGLLRVIWLGAFGFGLALLAFLPQESQGKGFLEIGIVFFRTPGRVGRIIGGDRILVFPAHKITIAQAHVGIRSTGARLARPGIILEVSSSIPVVLQFNIGIPQLVVQGTAFLQVRIYRELLKADVIREGFFKASQCIFRFGFPKKCPRGEYPVFQKDGLVLSIPDAISRVLENRYLKNKKRKKTGGPKNSLLGETCPDCGETISFEEGCMTCHFCGFTKCG